MDNAYISVRALGAVGDGQTDDTAAFEEALRLSAETGGEIRVPAGRYRIRRTLTLNSRLLTGCPAGNFCGDDDCLPALVFSEEPDIGLRVVSGAVSGLRLDFSPQNGRPDGPRQTAVLVERSGCRLTALKITEAFDGIVCHDDLRPGMGNPGRLNIADVFMLNIHRCGLYISGGLDVECIRNVEVWSPGSTLFPASGVGFHFRKNDGIHIDDCFAFNASVGFLFEEAAGLPDYNGGTLGWLTGCNVDYSGRGIVVRGGERSAQEHYYPVQITVSGGSFWCHQQALDVESGDGNVILSGVDMRANGTEAVRIHAGDSVTVSDCLIRREFVYVDCPAVVIDGGRRVIFSGNTVQSRCDGVVVSGGGMRLIRGNILCAGGESLRAESTPDLLLSDNLCRSFSQS